MVGSGRIDGAIGCQLSRLATSRLKGCDVNASGVKRTVPRNPSWDWRRDFVDSDGQRVAIPLHCAWADDEFFRRRRDSAAPPLGHRPQVLPLAIRRDIQSAVIVGIARARPHVVGRKYATDEADHRRASAASGTGTTVKVKTRRGAHPGFSELKPYRAGRGWQSRSLQGSQRYVTRSVRCVRSADQRPNSPRAARSGCGRRRRRITRTHRWTTSSARCK